VNGKIALEEHFNLPEFNVPQYVSPEMMREISRRLLDVTTMRLAEMDAAGIDYSVQSLNAPGVQGEPDPDRAVARARQVNDTLAEIVTANPTRYGGFATLRMQDPAAGRGRTRPLRGPTRVSRRDAQRLPEHR
jgi:predicted TIM-barrel fold metal-dependent hydrolase